MGLKTYDYIVTLKSGSNNKVFDLISQLLILIAITGTIYAALTVTGQKERIIAIVLSVIILASGLYAFFASGSYRFSLLISFLALLFLFKAYWIAILYVLSAILERQVKFKQEIGFDDEGITFNSFPKKTYKWHEINNVILKDDIITIDLYNNKIIQKELEDESEDLEKEFNEFCRSHLLSV
jgi:hypothetical protein